MTNVDKRVREHYEFVNPEDYVMIGIQGSQNYGLETEISDVDTKMLLLPSFADIVHNRKPVSTTRVLENDEHCDLKDIRLYFATLRKQNINFVEILFSKNQIVNPIYADAWQRIVDYREEIARMDTHAAVKCMKGMAMEKLAALQHPYPNKVEVLAEYGYDPKQLHHILRLHYFIENYMKGMSYAECLDTPHKEYLKRLKLNGAGMGAETAVRRANSCVDCIKEAADNFREHTPHVVDLDAAIVLDGAIEEILKIAFKRELGL